MNGSQASDTQLFDLFAHPFHILRIDPTASNDQVRAAVGIAQTSGLASADAIILASDAILDPERRLSCELSYPVDSQTSEVERLYALLSSGAPTKDLVLFANSLPSLSRANVIAHVACRQPAEGAMLYALINSHASIDATELYAKLKATRTAAGIPAPSWVSVNQGLNELLISHLRAAYAVYPTIEDAYEPVLECTELIFEQGERYQGEALSIILKPYRDSIAPLQATGVELIRSACERLQLHPDDESNLTELKEVLTDWEMLCRPLILLEALQDRHQPDFDIPTHHVRALMAHLSIHHHYEIALKIAHLARDALSSLPASVRQLDEDVASIESLSLQAKIEPLQTLINRLEGEPGCLIAALRKDGFGPQSTEPAKSLW
jgi:hypothetical protein